MSSLGINPDISLSELLEVAGSSDWSVQFSPMLKGPGGQIGGTFIRSAAPWKGMTKGENESTSDYLDRLRSENPGVADGLENAIQMSKRHADGTSGIALLTKGGTTYPVPQGAAELAEAGSDGDATIHKGGFSSVQDALDTLADDKSVRGNRPAVY